MVVVVDFLETDARGRRITGLRAGEDRDVVLVWRSDEGVQDGRSVLDPCVRLKLAVLEEEESLCKPEWPVILTPNSHQPVHVCASN